LAVLVSILSFEYNTQALTLRAALRGQRGSFSDDHSASNSSSSSSSSSSDASSGSPEIMDNDFGIDERLLVKRACPMDKYSKGGKCRPCSLCGPDLYVRQPCQSTKDTMCDWCLNPKPLKNRDFQLKCYEGVKIHNEMRDEMESSSSSEDASSYKDRRMRVLLRGEPVMDQEIYATEIREPFRFSHVAIQSSWKLEMIMEMCFYLALIALIFVIIRFITKSKPYYRTVTVNPPMLDESDNKNIIRAAEHIREKLGKKGYERLEEFL